MKHLLCFAVAVPLLAGGQFSKGQWNKGTIQVLDTDQWCGRPGVPDWPSVCQPPRSDGMALFADNSAPRPANPSTQIFEIVGKDAVYTARRTGLDGGLHFSERALTQYEVDGKHLLIKFDRQVTTRSGVVKIEHAHDKLEILETKKR